MNTRREFLRYAPLAVAPAFGGCAAMFGEKPLVRFGVIADAHYADVPSAGGRFYALSKARVAEAAAASGKVVGVFQGHDHVGGFAREAGLDHYTFPAMVEGAGGNRFAEVAVFPSGRVAVTSWV